MSITLVNIDGVFTITATSATTIPVAAATEYLSYDNTTGVLESKAAIPANNDLFNFSRSIQVLNDANIPNVDTYDFKNNTIVYGGVDSATVLGLFQIDAASTRDMCFKNLNILVEDDYTSAQGYLLTNFVNTATSDIIVFVDNCHVVTNIATAITVGSLIGDDFIHGNITGCSFTYAAESTIPTLNTQAGGIVSSFCAEAALISSFVYIANCFSTINIGNGGGGIVGNLSGQSIAAGTISTLRVYSCYSTGEMADSGGGGICGSNCCTVITAGGGSVVTIESCFSTGNITAADGGGIVGDTSGTNAIVTGLALLNINSCYSSGTLLDATCGGICGSAGEGVGDSLTNINNCYALDGVVPDTGFATGVLVGSAGVIGNITSSNNSFSVVVGGGANVNGRVEMTSLQSTSAYSSTARCIVSGDTVLEGLVLESFLVCEIWKISSECISTFAPAFGFCGCPIEEASGVFWPKTLPGINVILPEEDNNIKSRQCTNASIWEAVKESGCYSASSDECPNNKSKYVTAISVTSVFLAIALILIIVAFFV